MLVCSVVILQAYFLQNFLFRHSKIQANQGSEYKTVTQDWLNLPYRSKGWQSNSKIDKKKHIILPEMFSFITLVTFALIFDFISPFLPFLIFFYDGI